MKKTTVKKSTKSLKPVVFQTGADARAALLVVSLLINLFVFCLWIVLQITTQYDAALASLFLNR